MSTVGRIEVREFTRVGFLAAVKAAARRDDYETIDQVRYLQEYIGLDLQAATMVIERDYTDRHYIEEFAVYYSKLLTPPHSRTTRLHFFGDDLSPVAFEEALANAADGNHEDAQKAVNNAYLGFVVVRPLSTAPVGRTVLRFLATQDPERNFRPAEVTSTVHLCGFDLSVRGLPFQQQDQGVGACATTALWSMLAGAFRKNGQRPPLPTAITSAAHSLSYRNRRFPAVEGLNTEQMVAAIDQFGFAPEFFTVDRSGELFTAVVLCYLRSGFPVLLLVGDGSMDSGHAICVVGFSPNKAGDTNGVWSWSANDSDPAARLRYRGPRRFYLHDDRLGPYARCDFARGVLQSGDGGRTSYTECTIRIAVQMSQKDEIWAEKYAAPMDVHHAVTAVYPKIRLRARDLIEAAIEWTRTLYKAVAEPLVETRFELGGEYIRAAVAEQWLPPDRAVRFARDAHLSRYVGVVSLSTDDGKRLIDILVDATDIRRAGDFHGVLALVPFSDPMTEFVTALQPNFPNLNRALIA